MRKYVIMMRSILSVAFIFAISSVPAYAGNQDIIWSGIYSEGASDG